MLKRDLVSIFSFFLCFYVCLLQSQERLCACSLTPSVSASLVSLLHMCLQSECFRLSPFLYPVGGQQDCTAPPSEGPLAAL